MSKEKKRTLEDIKYCVKNISESKPLNCKGSDSDEITLVSSDKTISDY